jgi:hypothetical protein
MRITTVWIVLALCLAGGSQLKAQYDDTDSTYDRWFVGTSMFVFLGNLDTENPPNFMEVCLAQRHSSILQQCLQEAGRAIPRIRA